MSSNNYIEQKKNSYLYFQIGDSKYAVNSSAILEIMKLPELDYPQKLPNNTLGLLKYNNFVINVVDIRFFLDIEVTPYNIGNDLLIVKTDETIFGIVIDRVIGITTFEASKIDTIPFVDHKTIIDSLYKFNQETVFIVNIYAIENLLKSTINIEQVDVQMLFPQDETSKAVMRKRTQIIADKSRTALMSEELHAKKKCISFNLGSDCYCITLDYVKEALKDTSITRVPGTPDFIEGIMNLRGDYITVLNLNKFLNLPETSQNSDKHPVVIVNFNEMSLAFLIDKINELFEVPEEKILGSSEGYFVSEFVHNEVPYTILNIEKIFTDKRIVVTDM